MQGQQNKSGCSQEMEELVLPVTKNGKEKKSCHDQRPENRGVQPGNKGIAKKDGKSQTKCQRCCIGVQQQPLAPFQQPVHHPIEKKGEQSHMQTGNCKQMHTAGLGEMINGFPGKSTSVADKERPIETAGNGVAVLS